jgi:serine/threonine protein kinase
MLRIERLQGAIKSLIQASSPEQNDLLVPQLLGDTAHILNFYYKTLHFNHRDLKSDNVGYVIGAGGKPTPKLIDFGFSCLTWKGVQISGALYFRITDPCYIPTRDLMQFLYELISFEYHRFSPRLRLILETALTFPLDSRICKLFQGCSYKNRHLPPRAWDTLYDFLNNRAVHNPHTEPTALHRRMLEFMGQAPANRTTPITLADPQVTAKIKHCLPEQILNP